MNKSMLRFTSKIAVFLLVVFGLIELGLAMWTVLESRYKILAYNLADVGYIDLWILRYISMCLFASSIITLVMCLILIWGLCSAHVFIFIASVMITIVVLAELIIGIVTFSSKFQTRLTLQEQLPKLVITYRQGNDERASRALDYLQLTFRCCGSDGRLSYQNNVPFTCNMYSVGCLPRTMYFLDSCLDALASVLLFFSLIKLLIVVFFYSFLCIYRQHRRKHRHHTDVDPTSNNSSRWHHSSSFDSDSSSSDNLPKKMLISSPVIHQDNEYIEKRHVILNDYDSQLPNKRVQSAPVLLPPQLNNTNQNLSTPPNEPKTSRKLSSISEKTEKTETDESEPDLLRCRHYNPKRQAIITSVNPKQIAPPLPKKLPTIKNRKKNPGGDDDNDSGVERSSSEKSFEEPNSIKRHSATSSSMETLNKSKTSINSKPTPTLSFSNVFVTSVSQGETATQIQDDNLKKSLTTSPSSSSSFSDHLLLTDVATPKPILKKSPQQSSPSSDQDRIPPSYQDQKKISSILNARTYIKVPQSSTTNNSTKIYVPYKTKENLPLNNTPKPAPRPSLKQSSFDKQDESLV